ncbi:hypothetical protein [Nonomuraea sp. NPDC049784]|uniref:hypothetical protein n=1 Tax=Nonomuraea sp. NPDC049784 TaxID=3154361 RepID=UPI0033C64B97
MAVGLGGVSLNGERGSPAVTGERGAIAYGERGPIGGTVLAVLILAVVQGQLTLLYVPSYVIMIVQGGTVVVALTVSRALDALRA